MVWYNNSTTVYNLQITLYCIEKLAIYVSMFQYATVTKLSNC